MPSFQFPQPSFVQPGVFPGRFRGSNQFVIPGTIQGGFQPSFPGTVITGSGGDTPLESNVVSVDNVPVPVDASGRRPVAFNFRNGRLQWVHADGTTSGPGASTVISPTPSEGAKGGTASHDEGGSSAPPARSSADRRFFSADTSSPFASVSDNTISVGGIEVPKGSVRPIGFRLGANNEIIWVYRNESDFPGAGTQAGGKGAPKVAPKESGPLEKGQLFVVSAKTCGPCAKLKDFLTERGIPFTVLDVGTDWERYQSVQGSGLPQLFVALPPPNPTVADPEFPRRRVFQGGLGVFNTDGTPNETTRAAITNWISGNLPPRP